MKAADDIGDGVLPLLIPPSTAASESVLDSAPSGLMAILLLMLCRPWLAMTTCRWEQKRSLEKVSQLHWKQCMQGVDSGQNGQVS